MRGSEVNSAARRARFGRLEDAATVSYPSGEGRLAE